ncbi:hypothetical protein, partial [Duodenibacillus massiliensis]|uniref:hypothetical protein n=1 Tax=Duodenibacillus massiliensis TaxID=1852381 RepID=UPI003AF8893C
NQGVDTKKRGYRQRFLSVSAAARGICAGVLYNGTLNECRRRHVFCRPFYDVFSLLTGKGLCAHADD